MKKQKDLSDKKTVLAIHGFEADIDILRSRVEESGYRFLEAIGGHDGLEMLKDKSPHVVILSASLPDMSGFKLCRAIRGNAFSASLPIIMLSAAIEKTEEEQHAPKYGVNEYLRKINLCAAGLFEHPRFIAAIQYALGEIDQAQRDSTAKEIVVPLSQSIDSVEKLAERLQTCGFSPVTSVSTEETLDILRSTPTISCLLIDIDAEGLDVAEIAERVKALDRRLAIIGIGNKASERQLDKLRSKGMDDFVHKSVEASCLKRTLEINIDAVRTRNYHRLLFEVLESNADDLRGQNIALQRRAEELTQSKMNLSRLSEEFKRRLGQQDTEIKRTKDKFKALSSVLSSSYNATELRSTLQNVLHKILFMTETDFSCIIIEKDSKVESIIQNRGTEKTETMPELRSITGRLLRRARKSTETVFIEGLTDRTQNGKVAAPGQELFALCYRIEISGHFIGVVGIIGKQHQIKQVKSDKLLLAMGSYVAIAVENNFLTEDNIHRSKELTAFSAITAAVRSYKPDQVLKKVIEDITETLGLQGGMFHRFDEIRSKLHLTVHTKLLQTLLSRITQMDVSDAQLQTLPLMTGDITISNDVSQHLLFGSLTKETSFRSAVCMPLYAQGKNVGIITLLSQDNNHFSPRDIKLYTAIGQNLSLVYETTLLQETQNRKELEIKVLSRLAQDITESETLEKAQNAVVDGLATFGFAMSHMGIVDHTGTRIQMGAYRSKGGLAKQLEKQLNIRLRGLWVSLEGSKFLNELRNGKAIVSKEVVPPSEKVISCSFDEIIVDFARVMAVDYKKMRSPKSFFVIDSMIIVPIMVAERFFGVLSVLSREWLGEDDLNLLWAVAETVGQSIGSFLEFRSLRSINKRYEKLLECTSEAVLLINKKTEILSANQAPTTIFGTLEDIDLARLENISPRLASEVKRDMRTFSSSGNIGVQVNEIEPGRNELHNEIQIKRADQTEVWIEYRLKHVEEDIFLLVIRDITEQKMNEGITRALYTVSQALQKAVNEKEVFMAVKEGLSKVGLQSFIMLQDENNAELRIVSSSLSPSQEKLVENLTGKRATNLSIPVDINHDFASSIETRQAQRILQTDLLIGNILGLTNKAKMKQVVEFLNIHRAILTPLFHNDIFFGMLFLGGADLLESDVPIAANLGGLIALNLENISSREKNIKRERVQQDFLKAVEKASAYSSLDDTLQFLTATIGKLVSAWTFVGLFENNGQQLILHSVSDGDRVISDSNFPLGHLLQGTSLETPTAKALREVLDGQIVVSRAEDDLGSQRSAPPPEVFINEMAAYFPALSSISENAIGGLSQCSYMVLPLKTKNRVLGAVGVIKNDSIAENDFMLSQALCKVAASHIELLQTTQEAVQANEQFTLLTEQSQSAILLCNFKGECLSANQTAVSLLGFSQQDILAVNVFDLLGSDAKIWHRRLSKEIRISEVVECLRADNSRFWAECSAILLTNNNIIFVISDLTEKQYNEKQQRYQTALIKSIKDAAIVTDMELVVTYWNSAAEELYGWKPEKVINQSLSILKDRDGRISSEQLLSELKKNGSWKGLIERRTKTGEPVVVESTVSLISDSSGNSLGILHIDRDATTRLDRIENLKKSESLFRALLEHRDDEFVFLIDTSTAEIMYVSKVLFQQTGLHVGDDISKRVEGLIHGADINTFKALLKTDKYGSAEFRLCNKDGIYLTLKADATIVNFDHRKVLRIVARDISEQKKLESNLVKIKTELATISKIRGVIIKSLDLSPMLQDVLHEIQTDFGFDAAAVFVKDEESSDLRISATQGLTSDLLSIAQLLPTEQGLLGQVTKSRKPIFLTETDEKIDANDASDSDTRIRSLGLVPLTAQKDVVGVLVLGRCLKWQPTEGESQLFATLADSIGSAIKNCQHFVTEKDERDASQRLIKAGSEIGGELDMDALSNMALERLPALMRCDFASIHLINEAQLLLLGHKRYIEANIEIPPSLLMDETTPIHQVALFKKPCNIRDLRVSFPHLDSPPWDCIRSCLCVPLSYQGNCLGVLSVLREDAEGFNRIDEATAGAYANQIAVAIENSRRFEEEKQYTRHLQAVNKLTLATNQTLDPDRILKDSLKVVTKIFNANMGQVQIFDSETSQFACPAEPDIAVINGKIETTLWLPDEMVEMVRKSANEILLGDQQITFGKGGKGLQKKAISLMKTRGIHSFMIAPIKSERITIGAISVATSKKGRLFNRQDMHLLCKMAQQMGIAMQNARMFMQTRIQLEKEETFRTRVSCIHSLLANFNRNGDNSTALSKLFNRVLETLEYDTSSIYLLDSDTGKLVLSARCNLPPFFSREARLVNVGEEFCGKAVQSAQPFSCSTKEEVGSVSTVFAEVQAGAVIGIPIIANEQVLGAFEASCSEEHEFTSEEIDFLKSVASKLGSAIQNFRLIMVERKRTHQLSALCAASRAITKAISLKDFTKAVVRELEVLLPAARTGLYLTDKNGKTLKFVAGRGFTQEQAEISEHTAWDRHPGWVVRNKKPLLCSDIEKDDRVWYPAGIKEASSLLFVPLLSEEHCIGVLGLSSFRPNAFDNDDLNILTTYANAVVTAMQNVELYQQLQEKLEESLCANTEVRALQNAIAAAQSTLVPDEVLKRIADGIVSGLDHQVAVLTINKHNTNTWPVKAIAVNPQIVSSVEVSSIVEQMGETMVLDRIDKLANQAAETGTPSVMQENESLFTPILGQSITDRLVAHGGIASVIIIPLQTKEGVVGSLFTGSRSQIISEEAVASLQAFGQQAAFSIESISMHAELQQHAHDLERSNRRIELLSNVAAKVNESLDTEKIFSIVGHELYNLGLGCAVLLMDERSADLQLAYNSLADIHPKETQRAKDSLGVGLFEWPMSLDDEACLTRSLREGTTLLFDNVDKCLGDYLPKVGDVIIHHVLERLGMQRIITAPLTMRDKIMGLLYVFGQDLASGDIPAITTFATQLAVSMQNANLYEQSSRLARTVETLNDSVIITDLEGKITFANQMTERTYGYTVNELMGKSASILMSTDTVDDAYVSPSMTTTNTAKWHGERVHKRKNGQNFPVEVMSNVIYDEREQPVALLDIVHDISERKDLERQLVNSERYFRLLFDHAPYVLLNLDLKGKIIHINQRGKSLLGYFEREFINKDLFDFVVRIANNSNGKTQLSQAMAKNEVSGVELALLAKDGSEMWFEVSSSPVFDDKGQFLFVCCILRDISAINVEEHIKLDKPNKHRIGREQLYGPAASMCQLVSSLSNDADIDSLLSSFLDSVLKFLGSHQGAIFTKEFDDAFLQLRTHRGLSPQMAKTLERIDLADNNLCVIAALSGKVIFEGIDKTDDSVSCSTSDSSLSPAVAIPIVHRDKVVGIILASYEEPELAKEIQADVMLSIGNIVAAGLYQAYQSSTISTVREAAEELCGYLAYVSSEQNLHQILDTTVKCAAKALHSPASSVMLPDANGDNFIISSAAGLSKDFIRTQRIPVDKIDSWFRNSNMPVALYELTDETIPNKALYLKEDLSSMLVVPVTIDRTIVGLVVFYEKNARRRYTETDINTGYMLANVLSIALQRTHLKANIERQAENVERLKQLNRALVQSIDNTESFNLGLQTCLDTVSAEVGVIYLLSGYDTSLTSIVQQGEDDIFFNEINPILQGENICGAAIKTNEILIFDAKTQPNQAERTVFQDRGVDTIACVPVTALGTSLGCICLLLTNRHFLSESEREQLTATAQSLAIAMQRKRTYDDIQRNYKMITSVAKAAQDMSVTRSFFDTISLISKHAQNVFGMESVCVLVRDYADGLDQPVLNIGVADSIFDLVKGQLTEIFKEKQNGIWSAFCWPNPHNEISFPTEVREAFMSQEIKSGIALPLTEGDSRYGVLWAFSKDFGSFSRLQIQIATSFMQHASAALLRARSWEQLERTNKFNDQIGQTSSEAVIIQDAYGIITYANRAAEVLLKHSAENLLGTPLRTFLSQDCVRHFGVRPDKSPIHDAIEFDASIQISNRDKIPVIVRARALYEENIFHGVLLTLRDASRIQKANQECKWVKEKLEHIIDNLPAEYWTIEFHDKKKFAEGILSFSGESFCGIPSDRLSESGLIKVTKLAQFYSPETWTAFAAACAKAYLGEKAEKQVGITVIAQDDSIKRDFAVTVFPLYHHGQLIGVQGFSSEITNEIKLQEKLQLLESRYNNFLTHSEMYIYRIDSTGETSFLGGAFDALTINKQRYDLEPNPRLRDLVHPDDADKVTWTSAQLRRGDIEATIEFRLVDDENQLRWLRSKNVPLYDKSGNCIGIEGFAWDITGEKKLISVLEEQKKRANLDKVVRSLSAASNEVYLATNSQGLITFVTENVEQTIGSPVEKIIGKHFRKFLQPDKVSAIDAPLEPDKSETFFPRITEQRYVGQDGQEIWLRWQTIPWFDENGEFTGICARAIDVTQVRKLRLQHQERFHRLEEELNAKEKELRILGGKYAGILESVDDGIFVCDQRGQIVDTNLSACQLVGLDREHLLRMNLAELDNVLISSDDELVESYLMSEELYKQHERWYNIGKNRQTLVRVRGQQIKDNDQQLFTLVIRDIGQQRQQETALEQAQMRLRLFTENSPDIILTFDTTGSITSINSAGEKMIGCRSDEVCNQKLADILHPIEPEQLQNDLAKTLGGESRIENLYQVLPDRKQPRWLEAVWGPLVDDQAVCHGAQVVLKDITEHRRMNEQLRRESSFSKTLFENANIMVVGLDLEGKLTLFNKYCENITGYTREEVIGKDWFNTFLPKDARPAVGSQFYDFVDKGLLTNSEHRIIAKDGREKLISWSHSIIRDTSGNFQVIVNLGQDITKSREIEDQIRESEEKFRALYERTTSPIFQLDENGRFVYANDAALRFLEMSEEELNATSIFELVSCRERIENVWGMNQETEDGGTHSIEAEFLIGGKIKTLQLTMTPILLRGRRVIFSIGTDITERKRDQGALERQNKELEALNLLANAVIGKLNINELLQAALDRTLDILNVMAGGFFLVEERAGEAILLAHRGLPPDFCKRVERISLDEPFITDVIESAHPVCTSILQFGADEQMESELHVSSDKVVSTALRIKGTVVGLIYLMIPGSREMTTEETNLLIAIGNQVAIAIENARLYEITSRRDRQLSELVAASRALSSGLELPTLLRDMMQKALSVVPAASSGTLLLCEGSRIVQKESVGTDHIAIPEMEMPYLIAALNSKQVAMDHLLNTIEKIDDESQRQVMEKAYTTIVEEHKPLCVNRIPKLLKFAFLTSNEHKIITSQVFNELKSVLCAPIFVNERFFGFLILENLKDENAFDSIDEDMLGMFVKQAAVVFENAQLYDDARLRADTFSAIAEVGGLITSGDELQTTLDVLSRKIAEAARFQAVIIGLYDQTRDIISYPSVYTCKPLEKLSEKKFLISRTTETPMMEKIIKNKQPLLFSDVIGDPRVDSAQKALYADMGVRSIAAFPLIFKDKVIGIIELISKTVRQFLVEEEELFSILASQIAEAINSAKMMEDINNQRRNLEELSRRIIRIQEEERGKISRELHDEVGQQLTAMIFNLELMQGQTFKHGEEFKKKLTETTSLAEDVIKDVRRISSDLRPAMLDDLGVLPTIRWHTTNFMKNYNMEVQLDVSDAAENLPDEIKLLMYRVVQESLTNVAKHANADNVQIILKEVEDVFLLEIIDDGVGFDEESIILPRQEGSGLGLLGMRERLRLVGGSIAIQSQLGKGTRIVARFPLK